MPPRELSSRSPRQSRTCRIIKDLLEATRGTSRGNPVVVEEEEEKAVVESRLIPVAEPDAVPAKTAPAGKIETLPAATLRSNTVPCIVAGDVQPSSIELVVLDRRDPIRLSPPAGLDLETLGLLAQCAEWSPDTWHGWLNGWIRAPNAVGQLDFRAFSSINNMGLDGRLGASTRPLHSQLHYARSSSQQDVDRPKQTTVALFWPWSNQVHAAELLFFVASPSLPTMQPLAVVRIFRDVDTATLGSSTSTTDLVLDGARSAVDKRTLNRAIAHSPDRKLRAFINTLGLDLHHDALPFRIVDRGASTIDVVPLAMLRTPLMAVPFRLAAKGLTGADLAIVQRSDY